MLNRVSKRNANMLLFASQIVNIGFGLLAIFITLLADEIKLRPFEIGIIISIFAVARAFSSGFVPGFSDKIGRKTILSISLLFYALSTTLLGFARDFISLFILRIIEGAAAGAVFPTAEALLVDSVPESERGSWMGKYFTTFNFGFIIGPAVGGILFTIGTNFFHFDTLVAFMFPFIFTGFLGFSSFISILLLVKDVSVIEEKERNQIEIPIKKSQTQYLRSFLFVGVLSGFAIGLIIPIFTLYMTDSFNLDEGSIGFIFTISGSVALLVNYPAGYLSDKIDRMIIVIFGMAVAGLGFMGVGMATSLQYVILFFILRSIAFQAYLPAYRAFQADKIPSYVRGKVMGQIQSAFNSGVVIGPLIGSAVYELSGMLIINVLDYSFFGGGIPFLIAGFFGFLQVIIALYIFRTERILKNNS